MCVTGFANSQHYPLHYRIGLEFNGNILSCSRALTRKLQLGLSGPNWENGHREHVRISMPKGSWGVWVGALSPPALQQGS